MSGAFVSLPSHSARAFPFNLQRIPVKGKIADYRGLFVRLVLGTAARYTDVETRQAVPLTGNVGPCGSLK